MLALGQLAKQPDALLDDAEDFLIQPAGALLAVARDERDGVALVEQLHHAFDLDFADLKVLSDPRKVEAPEFPWRRGRRLHD